VRQVEIRTVLGGEPLACQRQDACKAEVSTPGLMPYLPPAQTAPRWLLLLAQLLAAVVFGVVLISALPFLLLIAGIGAVILLVALRQLRRDVNQAMVDSGAFETGPGPIDITPGHQRLIKEWGQRRRNKI
jgi:hypothetical protein